MPLSGPAGVQVAGVARRASATGGVDRYPVKIPAGVVFSIEADRRPWVGLLGVIDAAITLDLQGSGTQRTGTYRLITTLTDPRRYPAREIVALYHQRWEIETSYRETKSTILDGRVLRARTTAGITQEVYAVLIVHQALRTAIADASLANDGITCDRLSFTIALTTARDTIHCASAVLADTCTDLTGRIGAAVMEAVLPSRRSRSCPRITKRAISKHRAKGPVDRTNHQTRITTCMIDIPDTSQEP